MNAFIDLKNVPLFTGIEASALDLLLSHMSEQHFSAGTPIFHIGDLGSAMYIIRTGRVRIFTIDSYGREITINHYGSGQIFGEFSLLDARPRSASAIADEECHLLYLERHAFLGFLSQQPNASLMMMQNLVQRARYTTHYVEQVIEWVNHLASGDYEQVLQEMSHLPADGSIEHLVAAFIGMVKNVQQREEDLRQELFRLKVQIDEEQRRHQVEEIASTDFFARLKLQVQELKRQNQDENPSSS